MTTVEPLKAGARTSNLRRLWFNIHLWIGVALSLVFIPLGLTGAAMVWPELLSPAVTVSGGQPALSVSRYLDAARTALNETAVPIQVRLPAQAGRPVTVTARPAPRDHGGGDHGGGDHGRRDHGPRAAPQTSEVVSAPSSGETRPPVPRPAARSRPITVTLAPDDAHVISVGPGGRSPTWMWLHTFHERLFIEGWGRQLVGWLGFAMLTSALTGLYLWWPRAGDLLAALQWRRTPRQLLNLHYTTGFWICLPLALLALTGAALGFPQTSRSLIGGFAPVTQQAPGGPGGGGPGGGGQRPLSETHLTADAAAEAARSLRSEGVLTSLTLPTRAQPVWKAEFAGAAPVQVDDATGVAAAAPAQPGGDVFWRWVHRVHGGDDMPIVWKLILTLAGLAPSILGLTGVWVWIAKLRRQRDRNA